MSDTMANVLPYRVELNKPIKRKFLDTLFATGDNEAHRFDIELVRNSVAVSIPSGTAVYGYFIKHSNKEDEKDSMVVLKGSANGNVANVTLDEACYAKTCQFSFIIKVMLDGRIVSVFWGDGTVMRSKSDTIEDPTNVVKNLDDLLAQIAAMEAATADGHAAAQEARNAAANADAARLAIQGNLNSLEDRIDEINDVITNDVASDLVWEQGNIGVSNGANNNTSMVSLRIRTRFDVNGSNRLKLFVPATHKAQVYKYGAGNVYLGYMFETMQSGALSVDVSDALRLGIVLANQDDGTSITPDDVPAEFVCELISETLITDRVKELEGYVKAQEITEELADAIEWEQGSIFASTGKGTSSLVRIRSNGHFLNAKCDGITRIHVPDTHRINVYAYNGEGVYEGVVWTEAMRSGDLTVDVKSGYRYSMVMAYADHTASISPSEVPEGLTVSYIYQMRYALEDAVKRTEAKTDALSSSIHRKTVYNMPIVSGLWSMDEIEDYANEFPTPASTDFTSTDFHEKLQALFNVPGREAVSSYAELGQDDFGNSLYKYEFNFPPNHYASNDMTTITEDATPQKKPKIVMVTGIHGFERPATIACYYFIKQLFENDSEFFEFLRNNIHFVIIPLCCPSGWNGVTYENGNGRNLNRDFPGTNDGEPWSQPESNFIKSVIEDNLDMDYFIDWHNCYYKAANKYSISYALTDNERTYNPYLRAVQAIGNRWQKKYHQIDQTLGLEWCHNSHPNPGTVALWVEKTYGIDTILYESGMRHQVLGGYSTTGNSAQQTDHGDEYSIRQGVEITTNVIMALMRLICE